MHGDDGWHKPAQGHGFFQPENHVVAGAALVIAQVMVEAEFPNTTGLQQGNGFIGPVHPYPAERGGPFIVQKNTHGKVRRKWFAVCSRKATVTAVCDDLCRLCSAQWKFNSSHVLQRNAPCLPDRDLAYFPEGSDYFNDYVQAVEWARTYAMQNRRSMLELVLAGMQRHLPAFSVTTKVVNCHHNYVSREYHFGADVWVTRKGAIRAGVGEMGIVPGSMGARSFIVRGLGNPESFCSSAHGAGRKMSRTAALQQFTRADLAQQTAGVVCRKDKGVIDEIPAAYKDIDQVMANQSDLTEIVHTLKQVVCVKG